MSLLNRVLLFIGFLVLAAVLWDRFQPPKQETDWSLRQPADQAAMALTFPLSQDLRALVERLAGPNSEDGAQAWVAIGARYRDAGAFLAELRPILFDARPVPFSIRRERMTGGGHTFTYYTARAMPVGGQPSFVHSVGQALVYHLWQYEDVSNSGFTGTFKVWWAGFAPGQALPGVEGS